MLCEVARLHIRIWQVVYRRLVFLDPRQHHTPMEEFHWAKHGPA